MFNLAWASAAETLTYTGITVTSAEVEIAQVLVEIFADVTEGSSDDGNISSKNLRLLKLAVAYQAAWMTEHPDVFTNVDIDDMREGGASSGGLSFTLSHANAGVLAPMAKRCIDRLSWRRNRTWRVKARKDNNHEAKLAGLATNDNAAAEDDIAWEDI